MNLNFSYVAALAFLVSIASGDERNYSTDTTAVRIILDSCGCTPATVLYDDAGKSYPLTIEAITSTRNGRIISLRADGLLCTSTCTTSLLRPEIGHITELETLVVYHNALKKYPDELFSMKKLKYLDISGSNFDSVPPEIVRLRSLTTLHVAGCYQDRLKSIPLEIGNLDSLQVLDLRFNTNLHLLPNSMGNLKALRWLRLGFCHLDSIPPDIGTLSNLLYLELEYNNLFTIPFSLNKFSQLSILSLSYNKIAQLPDGIGNLRNLNRLYLENNLLSSLPDSIVILDGVFCTVGGNRLCNQPPAIAAWLDKYAGLDWRLSQIGCDTNSLRHYRSVDKLTVSGSKKPFLRAKAINNRIVLSFNILTSSMVYIKITDLKGRLVINKSFGLLNSGFYTYSISAVKVSGISCVVELGYGKATRTTKLIYGRS
jgi:Leucine-rich repeat (LRR) protein